MFLYIFSSIFIHVSAIFAQFLLHIRDDLANFGGSGAIGATMCEKVRKNLPLGAHLGAKMRQDGAKMAPSWPTWRQDVPKMANLEAKMANLTHFREHFGDFFWILGAILLKMTKTEKTTTVHHF